MRKTCRQYIQLIMLVALVAASLVPSGFMPGQDQKGAFQLVICTGAGFETITLDGEDQDAHEGSFCPFAPVLTYALLPQPAMTAQIAYHSHVPDSSLTQLWLQKATYKFWFAQPPPVFS